MVLVEVDHIGLQTAQRRLERTVDVVARAEEAGATGFLHKEALTSPDLADAIHVLHANYVASVPDPE